MLKELRSRSLREGVFGGSRRWLAVGVFVWILRAVQWAMQRPSEVVYRGRLEPGETLVVAARPPRRSRRRSGT